MDKKSLLIKDIYPGLDGSDPDRLAVVNGTLYFVADNGTNGEELWKSDGTAEGTVLVKDINPGFDGSDPDDVDFLQINNSFYFAADDDVNGYELWKSDGTAEGTVLVKNINPGSGDSDPDDLINIDGTVYFTADDGVNGYELWKSDGTAEGTVLVKDINPDISPSEDNSYPHNLINIDETLYFTADDGINGYELWKSDGTTEGTVLVKDIYPGEDDSDPDDLININGTLYFTADDGVNGYELWKSDGTAEGTVLVKDLNPDISPGDDDAYPYNLTNIDGTLYFIADDGVNGDELWKSDGTTEGTVLVKDIYPGTDDGMDDSDDFIDINGTLYFSADDGTNGYELWKSDGTAEGTVLVKDIYPGEDDSYPDNFVYINNSLYFTADDGVNGEELWKSDGTAEGTVLVEDINPGIDSSRANDFTKFKNNLYFSAEDNANGDELRSISLDQSTLSLEEFLESSSKYIKDIRDFDGNDLGASDDWKQIGSIDIQGDDDIEYIFVNPTIGRWATVGADITGVIDFNNHGLNGDTRVVGIYEDPLIALGIVEAGSDFDSQRRFQNDLLIDNLTLIDGSGIDYDKDGLQEIYFKVNDGTAVLHALMHADGNIQYANYQSEADLEQFMTANNIDIAVWDDWF